MASLPCCYVKDEDPDYVCDARRLQPLPMCERHTLRMFRDALVTGVLPNDVFSELVRQTDTYLKMAQAAKRFDDTRALIAHRESRAAEAQERRDNALVYYVRLTGDRVKIGWTTNLGQRLSTYRARAADLLAIEPGDQRTEILRHRQFAHLRIGRSEEFRIAPELIEHTQRLAAKTA